MKFSVLLSVYKKESAKYLNLAFESIWDLQALKPDQIVLVQDGPLSAEIDETIGSWKKKLGEILTTVLLEKNKGLAAALNEGLGHCRYELIARMDTDDIAMPIRFSAQLKFMKENPEISVCSGQVEEYSEDLQTLMSVRKLPLQHEEIIDFAKKRNPISHPCVIYRKSAVLAVGGYPEIYPEDYPLWILMLSRGYKFANLPQMLVKMRVGDALTSRRGMQFLKGEIEVFRLMRQIGFLTTREYYTNLVQRTLIRLGPTWFKKILYRYAR